MPYDTPVRDSAMGRWHHQGLGCAQLPLWAPGQRGGAGARPLLMVSLVGRRICEWRAPSTGSKGHGAQNERLALILGQQHGGPAPPVAAPPPPLGIPGGRLVTYGPPLLEGGAPKHAVPYH